MTRRHKLLIGMAVLVGATWLNNTSTLVAQPTGDPVVIAHRGLHQEFDRNGLGREDCTAQQIFKPTHPFLENTIPSMRAAFALGADGVELDVHPTTDGEFAVFHDWELECRTNGKGVTREASMTYLKRLDVGYGYTHDQGRTYPFRGKGIGMMPTLAEVLRSFPTGKFVINFKSRQPREADQMVAYLARHELDVGDRVIYHGSPEILDRLAALDPEARLFSKPQVKSCVLGYLAAGWSGYVPQSCRGKVVMVPINYDWLFWGWPNRFLDRMKGADATVILLGPVSSSAQIEGLTTVEQATDVPEGFEGIVWTDSIQTVVPAL